MVYCNRCGSRVPDGAAFCQSCGAPIAGPPAAGVPSPPLPSGVPPPSPPPGQFPRPPFAFAATTDLRPIPIPPDLPFHPQTDEVIYREIVPEPRLKWRLMLGGLLSALIFLALIVPFTFSILLGGAGGPALLPIVLFLVAVFVIMVVVSAVYAVLAFHKFRYWVTNHRTVGRRGVIGYSVDSIPLEVISDVVVQRSVADRILGLSSIWVQPFGGSAAGGYGAAQYRFGTITGTNSFLGLKPADATNIQQMIFHLRDVRRRETGRLI